MSLTFLMIKNMETKQYKNKNLNIMLGDNMELMKNYSDNYFDLAIVDPPYGIDFAKNYKRTQKDSLGLRHESKSWDENIPSDEYFKELIRVSKEQIVWGGNYFPYLWSIAGRGFIFWYKKNPVDNFSCGELAWTSFNKPAKCFEYRYYGNLEGNTSASDKIHPTQKPTQLYNWILKKYAEKDFKILDTHLGSGSSAVAAFYYGCKEFVGMEIDESYYNKTLKRIDQETKQIKLF